MAGRRREREPPKTAKLTGSFSKAARFWLGARRFAVKPQVIVMKFPVGAELGFDSPGTANSVCANSEFSRWEQGNREITAPDGHRGRAGAAWSGGASQPYSQHGRYFAVCVCLKYLKSGGA
jgi:hypothetical protein